jgi:hypothetical protein
MIWRTQFEGLGLSQTAAVCAPLLLLPRISYRPWGVG